MLEVWGRKNANQVIQVLWTLSELGIEYKVTLSHEPSKIDRVIGYTAKDSDQTTYTAADGRKRRRRIWRLKPESGPATVRSYAGQQDTYRISSSDPKEIIINEYVREYDSENLKSNLTFLKTTLSQHLLIFLSIFDPWGHMRALCPYTGHPGRNAPIYRFARGLSPEDSCLRV